MNPIFQLNKEAACEAGSLPFISETGFYGTRITEAKYVFGKEPSKSQGLEFAVTSPQGDARFISVWFVGKDGNTSASGFNMINAMMAITKVQAVTQVQRGDASYAPELEGKEIGMVLQKVLTSKADGSDSYKFELKQVAHAQTQKTAKELYAQAPAEAVAKLLASLTDRDDRKKGQQHQGGYGQPAGGPAPAGNAPGNAAPAYDSDLGW